MQAYPWSFIRTSYDSRKDFLSGKITINFYILCSFMKDLIHFEEIGSFNSVGPIYIISIRPTLKSSNPSIKCFNHMSSQVVWAISSYSAFLFYLATTLCFLCFHEIWPSIKCFSHRSSQVVCHFLILSFCIWSSNYTLFLMFPWNKVCTHKNTIICRRW